MGLLKFFSKSSRSPAFSPSPAAPPVPSGSFTVDRHGQIVTSTVSSAVPPDALKQIAGEIMSTFKEAKNADMNPGEFSITMGNFYIKARELRGGAIIFLSPRGPARK